SGQGSSVGSGQARAQFLNASPSLADAQSSAPVIRTVQVQLARNASVFRASSFMNVTEYYEHALAERGYQADPAQRRAVERLQRCYDEWVAYKARRSNALRKIFNRP